MKRLKYEGAVRMKGNVMRMRAVAWKGEKQPTCTELRHFDHQRTSDANRTNGFFIFFCVRC